MLSGDISFNEALSSLNVADLLKDLDDKDILGDIEKPQRMRKYESDSELIERTLGLGRKLDLSEKSDRRSLKLNNASTSNLTLQQEIHCLKEGQVKMMQLLEKVQIDLGEERKVREYLIQELRSRSQLPGNPNPMRIEPLQKVDNAVEQKIKELKKKLLLANLKILDLQNRKNEQ